MTTKAHTARRSPVNIMPRVTCARGDKCRFSHRSSDSKSGGKGNEGKKSKSEKDRCKKCGKTTNPPHWAKSCPENSSSSAQAVLTSTPVSPPPEVAPPGLSTPVNNSAKFGKRGGSGSDFERCLVSKWIFRICPSDETRDSRKVCWICGSSKMSCVRCTCSNQALVHGCGLWHRIAFGVSCSQTFLDKRDKVECSVAVGDRWRRLKRLDPRRDRGLVLWRHRVSWLCVHFLALSQSLQR